MPPLAAAALVFGTSAAILVLEILAGRLLAPYVGVTLETYTGIIGTVLAGISLGTWIGGRLADRVDPRLLLGPLLLAGGALALLVVPAIAFVGALRPGAGPAAVVLFSAAAFFLPAAVLSAVTPTVVKLQLRDLARTGTVVGRLSAIATAGAIVGTFVTGFVLVAALPSRPIVLAVGAVLLALGAAVVLAFRRERGGGAIAVALVLAVVGGGASAAAPEPCERESAYFCVRVVEDPSRPTGRTLYLDTLRHSYVDLADPTHLEFSYAQVMADAIAAARPAPQPVRALWIGGGGFTLPRWLAATHPGSDSLVLELDPVVLGTARDELGLTLSDGLRVRVGDARLGLADEPEAAYDVVVGDAFGGLAVPWHLATCEFAEGIRRVLRPDGIYLVNVIDYPPLGFARAEVATLRTVFAHVAVIAPPARIEGRQGGNLVIAASEAPLPVDAILAENRARLDDDQVVADALGLDRFTDGADVLTDDHAPVDQLLSVRE
jgi:spermidine synthase